MGSMATEKTPLLPTNSEKSPSRRRSGWGWLTYLTLALALFSTFIVIFITRSYPRQQTPDLPKPEPEPWKVAIIGAGPAGVLAADEVMKLGNGLKAPVHVTLYEQKKRVGGRLVVEKAGEAVYPFGDENQVALSAEHAAWGPLVQGALLDAAREHQLGGTMPIGGKKEKVEYCTSDYFDLTRPLSAEAWTAYMKELYYFGWSPKRSQSLGRSVHSKIGKIHDLQQSFSSLHGLVDALDVTGLLSLDGKKHLKNSDISDYYIDRVLAGEVAVQYGIELSHVNAIYATLATYNADDGRGRHGGKMQDILEAITTKLEGGSTLRTESQIVGIRHFQDDEKWVLLSRSHLVDGQYQHEEAEMFDAVILAAPYVPGAIEFRNTTFWKEPEAIRYRSAHLMWHTQSEDLYDDVFGGERRSTAKISDRLIASTGNGFAELQKQETRVDGEHVENLYRTLSPDLKAVSLSNASWSTELEIPYAYPDTRPRSALPPIELDDGFWHTGGIEAVGSSVGLSAWAGKNAARLAVEWLGVQEGSSDALVARSVRENGDFTI